MADHIIIEDGRFNDLVVHDAPLRHLADGCVWAEGPVWIADGEYVLWSDIPNNRIMRWSESDGASVWRQPSNHTNGHTVDRQGRLVSCEHSRNRISRTESDGSVVTLVERYEGDRFNSPNDLVVKSDDTIWFTDPPYGILSNKEGNARESEIGANYVYRFDPASSALTIVGEGFDRPNGIAFSPDEKTIYISDTGAPRNIRAFDVQDDGTLTNGRFFAAPEPPASDGFRLDTDGNMWTSAGDGVHVFTPEGTLIGKVLTPEKVANCVFGGTNRSTLFIAATTSLYSIEVKAVGDQRP